MPKEEKAYNGVFEFENVRVTGHIQIAGQDMKFFAGQQIVEVNPVSDVKRMSFLYVRNGNSIMIKRPGYMDVRKQAHVDGLKVSRAVSIAGAEPNYRKRGYLPGDKAITKKNVKCV